MKKILVFILTLTCSKMLLANENPIFQYLKSNLDLSFKAFESKVGKEVHLSVFKEVMGSYDATTITELFNNNDLTKNVEFCFINNFYEKESIGIKFEKTITCLLDYSTPYNNDLWNSRMYVRAVTIYYLVLFKNSSDFDLTRNSSGTVNSNIYDIYRAAYKSIKE